MIDSDVFMSIFFQEFHSNVIPFGTLIKYINI